MAKKFLNNCKKKLIPKETFQNQDQKLKLDFSGNMIIFLNILIAKIHEGVIITIRNNNWKQQ